MNIRDEMALAILPAIYADYCVYCRETGRDLGAQWREKLAYDAYAMADAMLAVRAVRSTRVIQNGS